MHPVSKITAVLVMAVVICVASPPASAVADDLGAFSFGARFESLGGSDVETLIERDFIAYDANYLDRKTEFGQPLHDLARRLAAKQMAGNDMACSIQLVIDNELVAMIRRMTAPIAVDDESVAWGDLLAAAPGSHFLMNDHTLRHCHDGFMPHAFARLSRDAWKKQGSEDLVARAKSIHRSIMDEVPEASPPDMIADLDAIVAATDRRLAA